MKDQLKKKEERLKRINRYHEKKREKDTQKKLFLEGIQENARLADGQTGRHPCRNHAWVQQALRWQAEDAGGHQREPRRERVDESL